MLTFKFSGANGVMTVAETLTSGMVGKQVKLEFTSDWDNLKKTAVFEAGDISEAVYNVGNTVAIPAAVLAIARRRLKIGIYGEDTEGNITPTIYAIGPRIEEGADPYRASGDPPMPKWKELEERIEDLEKGTTGGGSGSDSGQNAKSWTAEQINLLDQLFNYIPWTSAGAGTIADALIASLRSGDTGGEEEPDVPVTPEKTLNSISAVYSGGDVAVGTAVTDLTGIVVTAHYSDGTSETVTGYTLSGTIAEGSNTITVSYGGKTATFTVNGVAEIGGNEVSVNTWNTGYFDSSGNVIADSRYMCCEEYLPVSAGDTCYFYNSNRAFKNTESRVYWYTYDEEKKYLKEQCGSQYSDNRRFATSSKMMPDGAAFVRVSSAPTVEEYKDTAFMSTKMPEPVLTLADAEWYEGYILGDTGGVRLEEGCWYSDLISVEAGAKYRFANSDSSWSEAWVGIGFYEDITEKFISRATSAEFTVPDGAKYLRLSAQNMTGYCETATLEKIS